MIEKENAAQKQMDKQMEESKRVSAAKCDYSWFVPFRWDVN